MIKLEWHDLAWALQRTPTKILTVLKDHPNKAFIAGGFIRSCIAHEPINDIDIFAASKELALEIANGLAPDQDRAVKENGVLPNIHVSDNAYTIPSIKPTAQVIHRWNFDSPTECIQSFDFTIARAAFWWDGDKWQSEAAPSFYADLAAKRLIYCSPKRIEEVGGSMLRVLKFYQRGYRIPLDSLSRVIARLTSELDLTAIRDGLKDEAQVSKVLCGLLREVDPNIDPNHISHLPSKPEENNV